MKYSMKKILAFLLTMSMVLGAIPCIPGWENKVYAADSESSDYMRFETNYYSYNNGSYRIFGIVDGVDIMTTYSNQGWLIMLKDSANNTTFVGQMGNGVEKTVSLSGVDYGITQNLSIVNKGRYVKVEFAVRNLSAATQIISIGSGADVQIRDEDYAPITKFADGSGFYMSDGKDLQFNFIGKNAYGVTNVDTFWYGYYDDVNENMFNQVLSPSLTDVDSGMAFSWKDRTIAPGATNKYSVLIGIGALNAPPTLELDGIFAPGSTLPDVFAGNTFTVSGTVSDAENTPGTELYYAIDESTPVKFYTFSEAPGSFTSTIHIPATLEPGTHTITIYAQDSDGAISSAVQKTFTVIRELTLTGHDLPYTAGHGSVYLDPNFTVDYPGLIRGGKVYIESNFNSATDSLYFSNISGINGSYVSTTGVLTLSGVASAADYQAFIRNIRFFSTAGSGSRTVVVTLYTDSGNVVYYPANGHYYEYVAASGITWTDAKAAAEARTYQGLTGYLATITSAEENAFVATKCEGDGWLGGSDQGHDKEWYWVTGPEAGNKFCQQNAYLSGAGVLYTVEGWYQNFASGEPNDYPNGQANGENYLHMYSSNGEWNDYAGNNTSIKGYLVEYGTEHHPASGSVAVINVTFTDNTPPTIHSISGNPSSWTNGDVTLAVFASDAGSGLHSEGAYSFNNGAWTNFPSKTFTNNQTVNIRVRDNSGNIVSQDVVIDKIDKTAPTFTNITQSPTSWTSGPVTVTVNGLTDLGAGLHTAPYSFSTTEGVYNWQSSKTSPEFSNNQTVYVYVRDALGNISTVSTALISNIDTTMPNAPEINSASSYTASHWYNTDKTVTASFIPTAGCAEKLQYQIDSGDWIDGNAVDFTATGIYTLKFRVIDELGRTSSVQSCTVQIDKLNPTVSAPDTDYSWRNSNFLVPIQFADAGGSDVATMQYALTNSTALPDNWTDATISQNVSVADEGQWYIHYKVTDAAGNSQTGYYGPYKLDKTAPTNITVQYSTEHFRKFLNTITFGLFFKDTVTVTLSADDAMSGLKEFSYKVTGKEAQTIAVFEGKATFTIEPQFKGNFAVSATDNAGNSTALQDYEYLALDNNAPTVPAIDSGNYIPDTWVSGDVVLTVSGSTALSGIAKYQFTVTSEQALSGSETWTDISEANGTVNITDATATTPLNVTSSSITVSDTGSVYYHFRAVSNSGVNGAVETVAVKIDKVTPVVSVNANGYEGAWTKDNVRFDFSNQVSNNSGISYYYSMDNGTNWYPVSNTTYHEIASDTNCTYQFKAISGAGVEYFIGNYTVKIQKTAPQNAAVAISPATETGNNGWYKNTNGTRPIITITYPTITNTAPVTTYYKLWIDDQPSEATVLAENQLVLNADGIWNLKVWTEDAAGNKSAELLYTIKVDTTAPTGTITVKDNAFKQFINTVTFGLFFKQNVDVSITADSDLSEIANIEYYKSASELSPSQLEALTANDWTEATSFSVAPNDKFIVYARFTDKAGNVSVINSEGVVVYTDSDISEDSAYFDTDLNRNGYQDITINLELNGNTLEAIKLGSATLEKDVDYTIDGNTVTLKKEYLKTVVNGTVTFTLIFAPIGETFEDGISIGDVPNTKEFTITQLIHAEVPAFGLNLSGSKIYTKGDRAEALSVEATVTDNGEISYQWYVNGTAIVGATDKSYTPATDRTGVYDYYVVATNTNTSVNGDQTITAQSGTYRITVNNAAVNEPDIADNAPKMAIREDSQTILDAALTAEDLLKLETGYDIAVSLKVGKIDNVTPDESNAVYQIIGDNTFGQYIDISLMKRLVDTEGNISEEKITQLKTPLTITIDIPENLLPKDGKERTFSIIRVHNGVATILKDLDDVLNTITIQTDCFSTYAIVYTETSDSPSTGDTPPVIAYAMTCAALLSLVVIELHRKRRKNAQSK